MFLSRELRVNHDYEITAIGLIQLWIRTCHIDVLNKVKYIAFGNLPLLLGLQNGVNGTLLSGTDDPGFIHQLPERSTTSTSNPACNENEHAHPCM
jgi:hypothetical protein